MNTLSWILVALLVATIIIAVIVCEKSKKDYKKLCERIVVLRDKKPENAKKVTDNVLQLSNEIVPYLEIGDDYVALTVLKNEE